MYIRKALLALVLVFALSAPVLAQDATPEPEPPIVVEVPASETIQLTWTALAGLVSIVLTVGLGGGFAGALLIIRSIKSNDNLSNAIEKLYLSASPETQKLLRSGAVIIKEGGELAEELTDGVLVQDMR